jgi:hypothetical protein
MTSFELGGTERKTIELFGRHFFSGNYADVRVWRDRAGQVFRTRRHTESSMRGRALRDRTAAPGAAPAVARASGPLS